MMAAAVTTIAGGFLFGFVAVSFWDRIVEKVGVLGGFVAGGFIVGGAWVLNHGLGFVVQGAGGAWVDQAWAAFWAVLAATWLLGGKIKPALATIVFSIIGGTLAGFILSQVGLGAW